MGRNVHKIKKNSIVVCQRNGYFQQKWSKWMQIIVYDLITNTINLELISTFSIFCERHIVNINGGMEN